jgi:putative heme-binding domain-containing protein
MQKSTPRTRALLLVSLALPLGAAEAAERVRWTSGRVKGSADPPPPYRVVPAFPRLKFRQPLNLTCAPGSERLYVAEQEGKVFSFPPDPGCAKADLVLDLAKEVPGTTAIYGMTFHPAFERNRQVYLSYVLGEKPDGTRVSRFEMSRSEPPRIDPQSEKVLITWLSGGHNGGCLAFGPDGYLYISTGDAAPPSPPDLLDTGQDLSDLLSSILRIDVDRPEGTNPYSIPRDNPFLTLPAARPEIWAYGLRNPWKMSFDRATGDLWVGDVGWELWELVYRVERGGNYGWSVMEGRQPVRPESRHGPTPIIPPIIDHPHSEAASITGGYVYHGKELPALRGLYVYGDYVTGGLWGLRYQDGRVVSREKLAETGLQIVAFGEDPAGELYLVNHGGGDIHRIVPAPKDEAREVFPRKLSDTGLFASVPDGTPAPGVVRYRVNAELWSEAGLSERLLALPGDSRIDAADPLGWKFPEGTVLLKTLGRAAGPDGNGLRTETQLLHLQGGSWRPYTFAWSEDQKDALLVDAGGRRSAAWSYSSRGECSLCHSAQFGAVLGVNTLELNREETSGASTRNQIRSLEEAGLFTRPWSEPPAKLPRLVDPRSDSAALDERARSYLHVNCAHCHHFGAGGTALLELFATLPLEKTSTLGVQPAQGAFGIEGASIIAPGEPSRSVLYYRMAKTAGGHMPRVGSSDLDEKGLDLIYRWIAGLPQPPGGPAADSAEKAALETLRKGEGAASERTQAIRSLLSSTRGALVAQRQLLARSIPDPARSDLLAQAALHERAEVRDLFERFLPPERRQGRISGAIQPAEILSLKGDAARGREVFFLAAPTRCGGCHQVLGTGSSVGPDLTHVGTKYRPEQLLEQILDPSKEVAPEFAAYLLVTRSGQAQLGLLKERNEKEVVLKDAQGNLVRVPAGEVKSLEPQRESLMPQLLLEGLTRQAAADLVAYLASLK